MNIVVGVTARPESQSALERAVAEAQLRGARLHIVHTVGQGQGESPGKTREWLSRLEDLRAEGAAQVERLADQGVTATHRVEPVSTDPAGVLLSVADEVDADLIVLGLRRRSAVGKLLLGSVSQDVLLKARCPVLAVQAHTDVGD
jgi:nucleotide-binding universal stress UspA family protein